MKKVTMKDVAAAAGVSVAAVSRVMNGSGYVAPDKREAILQANLKIAIRSQIRESIDVFTDRRPELYQLDNK